ncbi:MAG: RNA polymerase subunit sigma, partial [Cellulosilyticaceae bacterium]
MNIQAYNLSNQEMNDLIEKYMPLIIKTISGVTGRYVSVENDEEFSIGLMAFVEAVEK